MNARTAAVSAADDASPIEEPRPITVGLDGDQDGWEAFDWALAEADTLHLPVRALHVHRIEPDWPEAMLLRAVPTPEEDPVLIEATVRASRSGRRTVPPELVGRVGSPALNLVDASRTSSLVVVGAPHRGALGSAVMGSAAIAVAARAMCPVVVVRDGLSDQGKGHGVVVGFDGSRAGTVALGAAFHRAQRLAQPLTVVQVWSVEHDSAGVPGFHTGPDIEELSEQVRTQTAHAVAQWTTQYPDVSVVQRAVLGDPVEILADLSEDAEMVVVGSHGRGEFRGLLFGSVSQGLLHRSHAPVMVVRTDPRHG